MQVLECRKAVSWGFREASTVLLFLSFAITYPLSAIPCLPSVLQLYDILSQSTSVHPSIQLIPPVLAAPTHYGMCFTSPAHSRPPNSHTCHHHPYSLRDIPLIQELIHRRPPPHHPCRSAVHVGHEAGHGAHEEGKECGT